MFLFVLFLSLFGFCTHQLINRYIEAQRQNVQSNQISKIINLVSDEDIESFSNLNETQISFEQLQKDRDRAKVFISYQNLKEKNPDYIGWISIPGTVIDYPVLQNKDDYDYYLYRNFDKQKSSYGSIYLDAACNINSGKNYVIYGHHMKDGSMFAALNNYQDQNNFFNQQTIRFDSLYEMGDYQIIAAFKVSSGNLGELSSFISINNKDQFNQFVKFIDSNKFYETGISYSYADKFLTLMTCEYSYRNGRIFIVAKKINQIT